MILHPFSQHAVSIGVGGRGMVPLSWLKGDSYETPSFTRCPECTGVR